MEVLVKKLLEQAETKLSQAHIEDAKNDSWLLAEYVFGITRADYYKDMSVTVCEKLAAKYIDYIDTRSRRIPLQYITGNQEFMGFPIRVNRHVLIPRQDTELLVETVVQDIRSREKKTEVLDLCTGSGCIGISIDRICRNVNVTGADISEEALKTASENNEINHTHMALIKSDLFENIKKKFDIIVSNPPYIPTEETNHLMDEVKNYEPRIALDGEKDGLKFYRRIADEAGDYLKDQGKIYLEIGWNQAEQVSEILKEKGWKDITVLKDLSRRDRVVIAGKE